ncbi:MAG TPA: hypothetical protein VF556_12545 [Pyrinomonadaceae bacterium]|jgi:hypothetical protein
MRFLLFSKLFIFLLCSFSLGQERGFTESKPIALINTIAFEDEKTGVTKLINANNQLYLGCCFSPCSQESHEKRKKILVDPVSDEIANLIKQLEFQNQIIILDGVKLQINGHLIGYNEKLNITNTIIPVLNEYFKTSLKPNLKLNLPEAKIAVINTNIFYDKKAGIKEYLPQIKKVEEQIKNETGKSPTEEEIINRAWRDNSQNYIDNKIAKEIQSFTNEKGFGITLDSSKKIPHELENIPLQDITNDFISYYNRLNP